MATKNVFSVVPDFLTEDMCDRICAIADMFKTDWQPGQVHDPNPNSPARNCDIWFMQGDELGLADQAIIDEVQAIYTTVDENLNMVKDQMGLSEWLITNRESLQYTQYGEGMQYGWHMDTHDAPYGEGDYEDYMDLNRKLSLTVFLNDFEEWEGGHFELENAWNHGPDQPHWRIHQFGPQTDSNIKKGTAVVFPSYCYHRVTTVFSGLRKSLVGWYLGPEWS